MSIRAVQRALYRLDITHDNWTLLEFENNLHVHTITSPGKSYNNPDVFEGWTGQDAMSCGYKFVGTRTVGHGSGGYIYNLVQEDGEDSPSWQNDTYPDTYVAVKAEDFE